MELRKSQRAISFFLSLIMLLALSSVFCIEKVYAASDGEWNYEIDANGAVITSYSGAVTAGKTVTVPATLGGQKVYKVEALCTNNSKSGIIAITFSEGIKTLGDSLCKGYTDLERVSLPSSLTSIGKDAFYGCSALKAITVPTAVESIGSGAFSDCTSLISASLLCRAKAIPSSLFSGCSALNTLTLPSYTESIESGAFEGCKSLQSVNLPDSIKTIGNNAFVNCEKLSAISLPNNLKTIGESAFSGCVSLKTVFIPNAKTVSAYAFSGCTSLTSAYISSTVTVLDSSAFSGCNALNEVVFGGDYYNFADISSGLADTTVYYPVSYASGWASYTGSKVKSYQAPTSVSLSAKSKSYKPGKKIELNITITPAAGEFNDIYTLRSSDSTVASISADGTITARATGSATITLTTLNGLSKDVTISVTPDTPSDVKVTSKSTTSVIVSWDSASNVTGYNVYRSTTKSGKYKKVGTTTDTSYTDKGLTKGKTYYYKVESYVNSNGNQITSELSSVKSITACAPAPATISAKKVKSATAKITWGKSTGCSGYEVYYAASKSGKYTKATTIKKASTVSATIKSGLKKGKTYYFKVRSYTTVNGKKIYSNYTKAVKVKV